MKMNSYFSSRLDAKNGIRTEKWQERTTQEVPNASRQGLQTEVPNRHINGYPNHHLNEHPDHYENENLNPLSKEYWSRQAR